MEIVQEVTGLEHLTLLDTSKISSEDFEKFRQASDIQAIMLERVGLGIYKIEEPNKIKIPKQGAFVLKYKPVRMGDNKIIAAAIRFYEEK